jgi:hypothetical protein
MIKVGVPSGVRSKNGKDRFGVNVVVVAQARRTIQGLPAGLISHRFQRVRTADRVAVLHAEIIEELHTREELFQHPEVSDKGVYFGVFSFGAPTANIGCAQPVEAAPDWGIDCRCSSLVSRVLRTTSMVASRARAGPCATNHADVRPLASMSMATRWRVAHVRTRRFS